jgi:hypothetical protein
MRHSTFDNSGINPCQIWISICGDIRWKRLSLKIKHCIIFRTKRAWTTTATTKLAFWFRTHFLFYTFRLRFQTSDNILVRLWPRRPPLRSGPWRPSSGGQIQTVHISTLKYCCWAAINLLLIVKKDKKLLKCVGHFILFVQKNRGWIVRTQRAVLSQGTLCPRDIPFGDV